MAPVPFTRAVLPPSASFRCLTLRPVRFSEATSDNTKAGALARNFDPLDVTGFGGEFFHE